MKKSATIPNLPKSGDAKPGTAAPAAAKPVDRRRQALEFLAQVCQDFSATLPVSARGAFVQQANAALGAAAAGEPVADAVAKADAGGK